MSKILKKNVSRKNKTSSKNKKTKKNIRQRSRNNKISLMKGGDTLTEIIKRKDQPVTSLNFKKDFSASVLSGTEFKDFADYLKTDKHLNHLNISNCMYSHNAQENLNYIAKGLKVNKTLITLDISNNEINDEGAIALADALKFNNTLTTLYINKNNIGDKGAKALADALKPKKSSFFKTNKFNNTLISFNISDNLFGDEGAKAFEETYKVNETLKSLLIDNKNIKDKNILASIIFKNEQYKKNLTNYARTEEMTNV